ncbi:sulfate transporter [Aggregicoccus sp. 17bor-14]|uniref:EI24 domain-containing protein n=1 Tax=Myxococcaceae TaxID=31 RepID=UPI00129C82F2|nr:MULTISPECIES: EI24 domain-containing protein [Myxococcaceae]MBF5044715.1 EI24 domain-containing protein [Simulacricoccus sp. 17bor-14]MRI90459.1 sulfate transporter [Aggregicoccus sp. 17bor-14]
MPSPLPRPSIVPTFRPRASVADFFQGLALPFQALGLILGSPRLRRLAAVCALVTLVSLVLLALGLWGASAGLLGWAWGRPDAWLGATLWELLRLLLFLLLLVVGANTVPVLLLVPLEDPLSEATEQLCGDFEAPPFRPGAVLRGIGVGLGYTLARVALLLAGLALLLPLNLVPGAGSVAFTALASLWSMYWMAAEYLGGPMARHLYPFREVRAVLRRRRLLGLGFGAAVYVILWVPVLNTLFLPLAIVGGTLLFRGLRAAGALPPPPGPGAR